MDFSIFIDQYRCIFVVAENCGFINTGNPSSTEKFGCVPVDSTDDLVHPEESTMVFGVILFFS